MVDLHSSREAGSAQGPPSATERRECKSRVTLLLRDADSGQIDHMAAEPTHGPHHPCTSSSRLGAEGTLLAIGNVQLPGGSKVYTETAPTPDPEDWRGGELSPAATRDTLLLPHPHGRRTGENCLSKLRRVVVTV